METVRCDFPEERPELMTVPVHEWVEDEYVGQPGDIDVGLHADQIDGRAIRWGTAESRFWSKVDKNGPVSVVTGTRCWVWTGATRSDGYGVFRSGGKNTYVHRFSYTLTNGISPHPVDHRCGLRSCVRPDHLRAVTPKQNSENRRGAQNRSASGVRGVCWDKTNKKWVARVGHDGKRITVGWFDSVDEAAAAVVEKRLEVFTHNDVDRSVEWGQQ